MAQIRQRYWFPRMVTKISNYINNCNICQLQKQLRNQFNAPLKSRKVVTNAVEVWYLDHFGPINTRKLGSLHSYAEDEPDDPLKEETKSCLYDRYSVPKFPHSSATFNILSGFHILVSPKVLQGAFGDSTCPMWCSQPCTMLANRHLTGLTWFPIVLYYIK